MVKWWCKFVVCAVLWCCTTKDGLTRIEFTYWYDMDSEKVGGSEGAHDQQSFYSHRTPNSNITKTTKKVIENKHKFSLYVMGWHGFTLLLKDNPFFQPITMSSKGFTTGLMPGFRRRHRLHRLSLFSPTGLVQGLGFWVLGLDPIERSDFLDDVGWFHMILESF